MPFKLDQPRRRIPGQTHKVMNSLGALLRSWRAHDASLRQRDKLAMWLSVQQKLACSAGDKPAGVEIEPPYLAVLHGTGV